MDLISYGIVDAAGERRTLAIPIPSGFTDAQITTFLQAFATNLDAVIGGVIADVNVRKSFTLPGGLKGSPDAGSDKRQGALLGFDAAGTDYRFSLFIPTWDEAGYTGNVVNNSGAYATMISFIASGNGTIGPSDKYENDLVEYVGGVQTFRK